jgi:hypothetical protein
VEGTDGGLLAVVERQEIEELADGLQRFHVVFEGGIGDRGFFRVGAGAAEFLGRDDLVGDGLHHVGTGDEHVGAVAHHEDEVGHGRRIDRTTGAGPHDDGNLRHDAGRLGIAAKDFGIAGKRGNPFLDAGTATVVQADHRRPDPHRHIHDLADLLRMCLGKGAAENREVLGKDIDLAAVDGAPAGDDAVARDLLAIHAEIHRPVCDIHVELLEGALVEQDLEALAGRQLALGMLCLDTLLAPAEPCLSPAFLDLTQNCSHVCSRYSLGHYLASRGPTGNRGTRIYTN